MGLLWQGIVLGLGLSILMGPMLFLFLQTGIEKGFRAGTIFGLGVWMSDILYIVLSYFGISFILKLTQLKGFELWMGLIGGTVLVAIGLNNFYRKPKKTDSKTRLSFKDLSKMKLWLQGFLINTLNPFAAFFWVSIMTSVSAKGDLPLSDAGLFFGGVIGTVIITDLLKIFLAKKIQNWLKYSYVLYFRRVSGAVFVILGFTLMFRVVF